MKERSIEHRCSPCINTSGAPLVPANSRPQYKPDTALIISSPEDSDSADEMNLCGPQSRTQSRNRRAVSRTHRPISNTLERKHSTSRNERGMLQSPVRGAQDFGKQRESKVAKAGPSSKKEKKGRASQDLPLNAQVTGVPNRTVASSKTQRPSRIVTRPVALTSSSKVPPPQNSSLSDLCSLATRVDNFSFPEFVQPRRSSRTQEESSLPLPDPLVMNRVRNEKRNKNLLLASQKEKGTTVASTKFSSSAGSSRASTRSGRKRFESGGESSSQQREEVPWADLVHFPSPLAPATPKSSRTGTSKSSQRSSLFPMHLTPPDSQMKKQGILDDLGKVISPGSGSDRSRKRKRSSMNEAPDLSEECVIFFESQYCF